MSAAGRGEDQGFDRVHLPSAPLVPQSAHGGAGMVRVARLLDAATVDGACNFIDLAVVPPGCSIGRHRHAPEEEEYYLVLSGSGTMWRDGEEFEVAEGDLIRNRPGGAHGLVNGGATDLRLFVVAVAVPGDRR